MSNVYRPSSLKIQQHVSVTTAHDIEVGYPVSGVPTKESHQSNADAEADGEAKQD